MSGSLRRRSSTSSSTSTEWRDAEIRKKEAQRFEQVVLPAKIMLLPNCVFRQSNPAVVGSGSSWGSCGAALNSPTGAGAGSAT